MAKTNKVRILHVDDEQDSLAVVKTILEKEGYEVVSVTSGSDALKEIDVNGFDLLLLDIMMPDMSGWDLFTKVSKIEKEKHRVIFLTVLEVTEKRLKELKDHGILDYITKPFERKEFVKRIKKALEMTFA